MLGGIKVKKSKKNLGSIFYQRKTSFFRAKNFNVSIKTHSTYRYFDVWAGYKLEK